MTAALVTAELGTTSPTAAQFAELAAAQPVVAVTRRLLADAETPVGVYRKLAGGRTGTFLLEAAEQGKQWSRWSFVGVRSAGVLTERDGEALWVGEGLPTTSPDPLEAVREAIELLRSPKGPDDPPLTGGLVGYLGYDIVRRMERLPSTVPDELGMPELAMMLVTDLAVLDHGDGTVLLIANVLPGGSYDDAVARLDAMATALAEPAPGTVSTVDLSRPPGSRLPTFRTREVAPSRASKAHGVARPPRGEYGRGAGATMK